MNTLRTCLLIANLLFLCDAKGRSVAEATPAAAQAIADDVAEVIILREEPLKIESTDCGFVYVAKVVKRSKGATRVGSPFRFGYFGGLEVGTRYRVYAFDDPKGEKFAGMLRDRSTPNVEEFFAACRGAYNVGKTYFRATRMGQSK